MRTLGVHVRHEIEARVDGAEHGRRQRRRVDEAAAAVDEVIAQEIRAGDIGAEAAEGLGEGADDDFGAVREPASPLAQDARRMGIVDDQRRVMGAGQTRDLRDRRHVAIHGEHALGKDEFRAAIALKLSQKLGEVIGVPVAVTLLAHARRLAAEMHAGVVEAVGENQRLGAEHGAIEQRLQHRGVGLEAGRHDQACGFCLSRATLASMPAKTSRLPVTRREAPEPVP
ncbi:hypothetical protein AUC69_06605 [Methyloceanibacter superfactus]|uniref:Uncharacterized protein n=1 Tax=Methyloceanibacter superfactus TaxID=1774969 RepID=A0A1E3W6S9_9HYPH|nr:hypothetical protein AUC69_06605 [Methyloceanibacter superfactus]